jgi:chromosome segregation ATPase
VLPSCHPCNARLYAADEIERLTKQRDEWQATAAGLSQDISNAEDEIERLRAIIKQAAKLVENYGDGYVVYPDEKAIIDILHEEARRED